MSVQVLGINHRDAPLSVRERVSLGPDLLNRAYRATDLLRRQEGVVILSTCNRTEIYVSGAVEYSDILAWWETLAGVPREDFCDALFWLTDGAAAQHLFRVACGIDSMVLGETQILGQVKDAYQSAQAAGRAGRLHRLFQYALRVGKRAHSETDISRNALSLGYAVVELSRKLFGTVADRSALIVGAGDTAELVGRHLASQHIGTLTVANRTLERAQQLGNAIGARAVSLDRLEEHIRAADVIVSCTASPAPVITRELAARALKGQTHKFRFFFDMAVPRDIDPLVGTISRSIFLYDIDDVTRVVDANREKRRKEVLKVERIIGEEVARFEEEMGAVRAGSVIRSLRDKAEGIRQQELEKAMSRLENLSDEEKAVVADTTRLILNKFLNDAMVSMRSWGQDDQKRSYLDAVRELFRLADEQADGLGDGAAAPGK